MLLNKTIANSNEKNKKQGIIKTTGITFTFTKFLLQFLQLMQLLTMIKKLV